MIDCHDTGRVTVVTSTSGTLDASNCRAFRDMILPIASSGKTILFDMSNLSFVDSSGLGALLSCLRASNASGGAFAVCCLSPAVRNLFELVRMTRVFDIRGTREDALQELNA